MLSRVSCIINLFHCAVAEKFCVCEGAFKLQAREGSAWRPCLATTVLASHFFGTIDREVTESKVGWFFWSAKHDSHVVWSSDVCVLHSYLKIFFFHPKVFLGDEVMARECNVWSFIALLRPSASWNMYSLKYIVQDLPPRDFSLLRWTDVCCLENSWALLLWFSYALDAAYKLSFVHKYDSLCRNE